MRSALLIGAILLTAGCGDSNPYAPAGPSSIIPPLPPPTLSGQWGGSLGITVGADRITGVVVVRFTQNGHAASGYWSNVTTGGPALGGTGTLGALTGTVTVSGQDLAFAGTVTWESPQAGAPNNVCTGAGAVAGTLRGGLLRLAAPSIPLTGCQSIANFAIEADVMRGEP